jgi:hypothetical protein
MTNHPNLSDSHMRIRHHQKDGHEFVFRQMIAALKQGDEETALLLREQLRALESGSPVCVALVRFDARFHKFDWTLVADYARQALMNTCASLQRQNEATLECVREATRAVRELTRELEEAA